jgi:molybdopterin converting factor small subunit
VAHVVVPAALRQFTDGAGTIEADGATLAEVLDAVEVERPLLARRIRDETGALRRFVNVYVDGEDARRADGLATAVAAGSEVLILPSVAGG